VKTRQQKQAEIEALRHEFAESPNALLIEFRGLKVVDDERLRRELRLSDLKYHVVKNTLALRAAKGTPIEQLSQHFAGPTAVALSKGDPVKLAKILSRWAKENPALKLKAGIIEGKPFRVEEIEALGNLPSKEELISKMMFLIKSGAQRLAAATSGVARNLVSVLDQVRAQKAQG
jgi:large subunit ribosomal protein L10